jgi:hypothetical protein
MDASAAIVVPNADRLRHIEHEDFTVADFPRARRARNRPRHFILPRIRHHRLNLDFRQQIHFILHAPIHFFVALLPAMAPHFRNCQSIDADIF